MRIPILHGIIDRRILANYHIDPAVLSRILPGPFRPKLIKGFAIGGICLIRLKSIRPRFLPIPWGLQSENAAHRIAVEWDEEGQTRQGVYIPRRDTSSRFNTWVGGTLFPGLHHHGKFAVLESNERFSVTLRSDDGDTSLHVSGSVAQQLPKESVFSTVAEASEFFKNGSLGYSATKTKGRFDGLELQCQNWLIEPLAVEQIKSSYFENELCFPRGSVAFDCALLMRGIYHEWHSRNELCCEQLA